jgi:acetyl-CoA acyltransferase 1
MSSDSDSAVPQPNGGLEDPIHDDASPRPELDTMPASSSQITLLSTEAPASPIDDANESFKTDLNDDRPNGSAVIPSSLTPPPSSQVPTHHGNGALHQVNYINSQHASLFSPPATTLNTLRRDTTLTSEYAPPTARQVLDASADELRAMMQNCIAEHVKLKMEAAHHKLQYNLLSLQADEDAKRAAVEHEMTRREVEALRMTEHSRQARRELSAAPDSAQTKYLQMKMCYEAAVEENETLNRRVKLAKKVIQQKEEEIMSLAEERDMLLNRIRENREHFHILCSPGGIFHGALTPKQQTISTPQQYRATPRQTPRSAHREARPERDHGQERLDVLLQALSQDNNSAPSTPTTAHRPQPRTTSKHTRNVQSLSSLPTTPISRPRGEHGGLLPSVDLVPHTEPTRRYSTQRFGRPSPPLRRDAGRKSRESTISAEDNEELARQALESVAAAQHSASFLSQVSRGSRGSRQHGAGDEEEEEVFESQASQAASEMLRRDPRESFEVASSVGSRDGTPAPAEKTARLQAKLFSAHNKTVVEKRKFSGGTNAAEYPKQDHLTSPTKKMKVGPALSDNPNRVGLGILHSQ